MKRMLAALLVCSTCACVPLPSVSLRVRTRVQHTQTRSTHALEARVDCGWSLEPRMPAHAAPAAGSERLPGSDLPPAIDALPCQQPSVCSWAAQQRDAALAALMSPSPQAPGGAL